MENPWFIRWIMALLKHNIKEITGLENLPQGQGFILVANHQSYLDAIFLQSGIVPYIKKGMYSISKSSLKRIYGSFGHKYLGMIYIDPKDKKRCLDASYEYLKRGEIMCIFPEGGRNFDPVNLIEGKTGAARLALWAKAPVVPVGIYAPAGKGVFQAIANALLPRQKARLIIGKPMLFERYYNQEITKEILREVTRQIMSRIGELCGKKYPY